MRTEEPFGKDAILDEAFFLSLPCTREAFGNVAILDAAFVLHRLLSRAM